MEPLQPNIGVHKCRNHGRLWGGRRRRRVVICFVKENEPRLGWDPKHGGEFTVRLSQTVRMQQRSRSVVWSSLQVLYAIFMSLCKIAKKPILLSTERV